MTDFVCARCPRALGGSCCEVRDDEHLATITLTDVERIAAATGLAAASFSEEEWMGDEEARGYEERRPLYRGYFRHAPRRLTLRRRAGACVFLDRARGCTLAAEVRPTACALYPFEQWPDGSWSLQVERHGSLAAARGAAGSACLAVEEAEGMDDVLAAFGATRAGVEALGARLAAEVQDHARRTSPAGPRPSRNRRR